MKLACHNMLFDIPGPCVDYAVLVFEFLLLPAKIVEGFKKFGQFMIHISILGTWYCVLS